MRRNYVSKKIGICLWCCLIMIGTYYYAIRTYKMIVISNHIEGFYHNNVDLLNEYADICRDLPIEFSLYPYDLNREKVKTPYWFYLESTGQFYDIRSGDEINLEPLRDPFRKKLIYIHKEFIDKLEEQLNQSLLSVDYLYNSSHGDHCIVFFDIPKELRSSGLTVSLICYSKDYPTYSYNQYDKNGWRINIYDEFLYIYPIWEKREFYGV